MRKRAHYLAIHYRDYGDPLDPAGDMHQGHWKEFMDYNDASLWLQDRARKSATSPQGQVVMEWSPDVFKHADHLVELAYPNHAPNFKKALHAWLVWRAKSKKR